MPAPQEFLDFVDANADAFIQRLADAVAFHSVSGDVFLRAEVIKMGNWVNDRLTEFGVETKKVDIGQQQTKNGPVVLPPVIVGRLGNDPDKKTVLVYGHFDVQPANKDEGWDTPDPFTLVVKPTGQLVGRGSTDDKGPVVAWLNVLQYYSKNNLSLPVNLRFCFEGMEESSSVGFESVVKAETQEGGWFEGVKSVCITDNYWLNTATPAVTYGLRGITYFGVTVTGPSKALHSGIYGRMVHEPMTDLIIILSKLVDSHGNILIRGIEDMVPDPTQDEENQYRLFDYSIADLDKATGAQISLSDDKAVVLMGKMRFPSVSLHGITGAYSGDGLETIIPPKVTGKFSIRLVPPQTPENVNPLVVQYITEEFNKLNTKCTLSVDFLGGADPWKAPDTDDWNYDAAKRATKAVYNKDPELTREGGSIGSALTFAKYFGRTVSILLLPMGRGDDGAHSTNEKLDKSNYIGGTKLFGTYLYEVAASQV